MGTGEVTDIVNFAIPLNEDHLLTLYCTQNDQNSMEFWPF